MPTNKLMKKTLSHILLHAFCLHFLRIHTNTFWKFANTTSFGKYKWKVAIYLFNYDSSKSVFFMLNMAFDFLLSTVSYNIQIERTSCSVFWYVHFYKTLLVLQHDIIIFYSILTSISNHTFNNNLNDEEMITSHFMCSMKQQ